MGPFLEAGQNQDPKCITCEAARPVLANEDGVEERDGSGVPGEAQRIEGIKIPHAPTEKEIREHEDNMHLPFRDWCKHCVFGRGKSDPHRKQESRVGSKPRLIWDYMYLTERGKDKGFRPDVVTGEGLPIVVMKDSKSKAILAYAVPNKGDNEYAIKRGAQDANKILGYKDMVFKGDQEPALQVMMDRISSLVGDQVIREESPVGESQSHGEIEVAVQMVQGMFRTLRSDTESELGFKIPSDHPSLAWLLDMPPYHCSGCRWGRMGKRLMSGSRDTSSTREGSNLGKGFII